MNVIRSVNHERYLQQVKILHYHHLIINNVLKRIWEETLEIILKIRYWNKKNLERLQILKTTINLENITYEEREMLVFLIEIDLNQGKDNKKPFWDIRNFYKKLHWPTFYSTTSSKVEWAILAEFSSISSNFWSLRIKTIPPYRLHGGCTTKTRGRIKEWTPNTPIKPKL